MQNTKDHSLRVQKLALLLGQALGLTRLELETLSYGALLHDLGKKLIPREILLKPEKLAPAEWKIMTTHSYLGSEMVKKLGFKSEICEIVLNHHLHYDGQGGYPILDTKRPSPLAQITTVADVFDAMTEDRPYRKALSRQTCLNFLAEKSGTWFAPEVVKVATQILGPVHQDFGLALVANF